MAELPRLNGIIKALEEGGRCFCRSGAGRSCALHQRPLRRRAVRDGARPL